MSHQLLIAILLLAPVVGFLFNGVRFRSKDYKISGIVASAAILVSFICSVLLFFQLKSLPVESRTLSAKFFDWIHIGQFKVDWAFAVDPINAVMILIISGVGFLIHIFSIGYMSHDPKPAKYFSFLNLFVFNMLMLVLGDNLLVMFVGWEGVGLCSYLLIGFWYSDSAKAAAGMKAFITNRVGDAGFLLGMFFLYTQFGTLVFSELAELAPSGPIGGWTHPVVLACLFLFIGASGKSAQIPLYVWLPDAMAGPTPVSALIHAATMVTAGVYMIVRLSPMFIVAENVMMLIATIGALTAFFAATIGMTQWDIKKILAYSTVSQLGYMFLAVGVGAFSAAMFHLMTHAFFKALMFLGSASVIHAMHEEQDVRKMGGLRKQMPVTHWTFVAGWLAIIGTPLFSGFFSKDEILWLSFWSPMGGTWLWVIGVMTAGMTAFYMTRLMSLTFWGGSRVPSEVHPHEAPASMTFPLIVLAVLSVFGGWIGVPHVIGHVIHVDNFFYYWLKPHISPIPGMAKPDVTLEWILMGVSVATAITSAYIAYYFYVLKPGTAEKVAKTIAPVDDLVSNKYWVDEFYFARIIDPLIQLSKDLWQFIDVNFIDRTTFFITDVVRGAGQNVKAAQNGNLQQYAMYAVFGIVVICFLVFMR